MVTLWHNRLVSLASSPVSHPRSSLSRELAIDAAASVFAQHGFTQAPVHALAASAGYSKAGLLKRFGSKAAVEDAVVAAAIDHSERVAAAGQGLHGAERDEAVLAELIEVCATHPGYAALMISAFALARKEAAMIRLQPAVDALLGALDASSKGVRRVENTAAMSGAVVAVLANLDNLARVRGIALAAALRVLG